MLSVSGLVAIPSDPQLKEVDAPSSGIWLNFNVISQEKRQDGNVQYHKYPASMWINKNELEEWREKIEGGAIFYVAHANWSAIEKDDLKYPIMSLKLNSREFKRLKTPAWHS